MRFATNQMELSPARTGIFSDWRTGDDVVCRLLRESDSSRGGGQ